MHSVLIPYVQRRVGLTQWLFRRGTSLKTATAAHAAQSCQPLEAFQANDFQKVIPRRQRSSHKVENNFHVIFFQVVLVYMR